MLKQSVWCWVGGWVFLLHEDILRDAQAKKISWIRPASDAEVKKCLGVNHREVE